MKSFSDLAQLTIPLPEVEQPPKERLVAVRPYDSCFCICEYEVDDKEDTNG